MTTLKNNSQQTDGLRLSPHMALAEFLNLRKYPDNIPAMEQVVNLTYGSLMLLEPARALVGPILINSGYRNARVNRLVGGVRTRSTSWVRRPISVPAIRSSFSVWWNSCVIMPLPTSCSPVPAGSICRGPLSARPAISSE